MRSQQQLWPDLQRVRLRHRKRNPGIRVPLQLRSPAAGPVLHSVCPDRQLLRLHHR